MAPAVALRDRVPAKQRSSRRSISSGKHDTVSESAIIRRYQFKLYPSKAQSDAMHEQCRMMVDLWNALLQRREDVYRREKRTLTFYDMTNEITGLRRECEEWRELSVWSAHRVAYSLDLSFKAFFRRIKAGENRAGYPRYRPRARGAALPHRFASGCRMLPAGCERLSAAQNLDTARSWYLTLKGVEGRIRARGQFPAAPTSWKDADVVFRDGSWWISVCVEMPARQRDDDETRAPYVLRFDLVDEFARVERAEGRRSACAEGARALTQNSFGLHKVGDGHGVAVHAEGSERGGAIRKPSDAVHAEGSERASPREKRRKPAPTCGRSTNSAGDVAHAEGSERGRLLQDRRQAAPLGDTVRAEGSERGDARAGELPSTPKGVSGCTCGDVAHAEGSERVGDTVDAEGSERSEREKPRTSRPGDTVHVEGSERAASLPPSPGTGDTVNAEGSERGVPRKMTARSGDAVHTEGSEWGRAHGSGDTINAEGSERAESSAGMALPEIRKRRADGAGDTVRAEGSEREPHQPPGSERAVEHGTDLNVALRRAAALCERADTIKSARDKRYPRRPGVKFSWRSRRETSRAATLTARAARIRREALHVWSSAIVAGSSDLTLICQRVKEETASGRGDEKSWGANTEIKAKLNRAILNQSPALARSMFVYKAEQYGIRCDLVEDETPAVAIGGALVAAAKIVRRAKQAMRKQA
jgi:hypothetical protein